MSVLSLRMQMVQVITEPARCKVGVMLNSTDVWTAQPVFCVFTAGEWVSYVLRPPCSIRQLPHLNHRVFSVLQILSRRTMWERKWWKIIYFFWYYLKFMDEIILNRLLLYFYFLFVSLGWREASLLINKKTKKQTLRLKIRWNESAYKFSLHIN